MTEPSSTEPSSSPEILPPQAAPPPPREGWAGGFIVVLVLLACIGAGLVYEIRADPGNLTTAAAVDCAPAKATAARLESLAKGQIAALTIEADPKPLTDVSFLGANNAPEKLSDFRGRTVLLNLWATWCIPCREEMPSLDKLQVKLGGPGFQVVAVSVDTANLDKRQPFLDSIGVHSLPFYADPTADILETLKQSATIFGLPTSFLIDPNGCELGTIAGPAVWNSDDATNLITAALAK